MPPIFRIKKLKKGEVVAFQRGKVTAMRWKDNRDMSILSTICNAEILQKIFFHLLELALWNSFSMYKKSGGRKNALDFRVAVIEK